MKTGSLRTHDLGASTLFVGDHDAPSLSVHPVVLVNIIDHFNRRHETGGRVIGTILGVIDEKGAVEVTNCFPVPHSETVDAVAVDMTFHSTMFNLHQRVNASEVIVGWYSTGTEITQNSVLIHDFYSKEVPQPFHLLLDTNLTSSGFNIRAFVSAAAGNPEKSLGSQFLEVSVELETTNSEKIGLDQLSRCSLNSSTSSEFLDPSGALKSDMENMELAVKKLVEMIDSCESYVNDVLSGKKDGDRRIGRFLADTVAEVPFVDKATFETTFENNQKDVLMVLYLSSLKHKV